MFFIVDGNNANDNGDFEITYTSSIVKFNELWLNLPKPKADAPKKG